jgi:NTE family protein
MHRSDDKTAPVTLVLGAGGPVGHAYHAGVLRAIAEVTRWDPRHAELVVGTSAGAQVGALLRAGLSVHDLFARVTGAPVSPEGREIVQHLPSFVPAPVAGSRDGQWPASSKYVREALRRPWRMRPGRLITALLREGTHANEALGESFSRLYGTGWPVRPLWITAVCLDSGRRVVFGRDDAPRCDVGTALRCSSAVPRLRQPVAVGERRYVDGGVASSTHLDLAREHEPRLTLVSSPLSRFFVLRWQLRGELRRLGALHRPSTIVFEPRDEVIEEMGWNPMNAHAGARVAQAAYERTVRLLEAGAPQFAELLLKVGEQRPDRGQNLARVTERAA